MKILVIGGGGREHAIVMKLAESRDCTELHCAPGNGGISKFAICHPEVKATDIPAVLELSKQLRPELVFVAPDDPLVMGMADALRDAGFRVFGPSKAAAQIEGSKAFSKELMKKYGIPTADYELFTDADKACEYIERQGKFPVVIKADGLALGKGVIIAQNLSEAQTAVRSMMEDKIFGESGSRVVVEEFLTGPEISVLSFTDGKTVAPMISSMDHKRALDNDEGLNTGGMGTIAPNPCYTTTLARECEEKIFIPTIRAMEAEGRSFSGCLYFGLMATDNGVKVIEYNCRFGDPEAQVVLPLLETDFLDVILAVCDSRLDKLDIKWKNKSAACVILASGGYPVKYESGKLIEGLDDKGQLSDAMVFHSGTKFSDGFYTAGGRVLGVTCTAPSLDEAISSAYRASEKISFEKLHKRNDIGRRALGILNNN